MIKKILGIIIPCVLLFAFIAKADVAPDPGKVRVKINLVTQTTEDLTDYRFFLDFYGDLHEVEIKSKGRTEIPPMGGGARYASGRFLAIPKKDLSGLPEKPSKEQLENLSSAISKKEVEGVVELSIHQFSADIPAGKKTLEVVYQINRAENTLRAERVSNEKSPENSSLVSTENRAGYIIGGVLITLAVLFGGIFVFRKASRKV